MLIEISLRLHLARLSKSDRRSLQLLLLLLHGFVLSGTPGPLFRREDIPINGVFPAREFIKRRELDVLGQANGASLEPSGFPGFRLEPPLDRFFRNHQRWRRRSRHVLFVVGMNARPKISGQYQRPPHECHPAGIVRQWFRAQDLWEIEFHYVALPPDATDLDVGIRGRKIFQHLPIDLYAETVPGPIRPPQSERKSFRSLGSNLYRGRRT